MAKHQVVSGLAVGTMLIASVAMADILEFNALIDGEQAENCAGSGSPGTGTGSFTLDTDTGFVVYEIEFSGLIGTETNAHVHGAAPMCAGAGIVYPLPLGSPKNGNTTLDAGEMQDMIDGLHYVNIHSTFNTSGEIRGQIILKTACPWDCDGIKPVDGVVGIVDLLALLSQWGGPGGCDFDDDRIVGITDLIELLANWGPCP